MITSESVLFNTEFICGALVNHDWNRLSMHTIHVYETIEKVIPGYSIGIARLATTSVSRAIVKAAEDITGCMQSY